MKSRILNYRGVDIEFVPNPRAKKLSIRVKDSYPMVRVVIAPGFRGETITKFIDSKWDWIIEKIDILKAKMERERQIARTLTVDDYKRFFTLATDRINYWSGEMGLSVAKVSFRQMTSRWGSCRPSTRSITINSRLATKPEKWLDYVVVHEIAHIRHANHSAAFWALVGQYFPDYQRIRQAMRHQ